MSTLKSFPDGHYYSPINSISDINTATLQKNKSITLQTLPSLNLDQNKFKENIEKLGEISLRTKIKFPGKKGGEYYYYYRNDFYSYTDALVLSAFIEYLNPNKIIEIGSGFSSAVMHDVITYLNLNTTCYHIEPYPDRLKSVINKPINIIEKRLQDVDLSLFRELQANDILFIDSTHVAKAGSDVNYYISQILPVLNSGVYIHIHDIFWPFEYSEEWLKEGRSWNECYILRAFLQYNNAFSIEFFNHYMWLFYRELMTKFFPVGQKNYGGSIWLKKL